MGLAVHVLMDYTLREIDNYARGVDARGRADMAAMLWAAREGAGFNAYAFAGKRIPKIDIRLKRIIQGTKHEKARSDVASVIVKMQDIALRAGMPPPRPRARKVP